MAYENLIKSEPIERELIYKGKSEKVYFKPLTAGDRLQLQQGQRGKVGSGGEVAFDVDLGEVDLRNHKLLAFANCDAAGKKVFKNVREVQELPEDLVKALLELCADALKEDSQGN